MKFDEKIPPRRFLVGNPAKFEMKDCGNLCLDPDEKVTFVTSAGAEYDVARKSWGYYATPSLNSRLLSFGLRAVMVKNSLGRYFILLVERGKEDLFDDYVKAEELQLIGWIDTGDALERLERAIKNTA